MASDAGLAALELHSVGSKVWEVSESGYYSQNESGSSSDTRGAPPTTAHVAQASSQQSWGEQWVREAPAQVVAASFCLWTFLYFSSKLLLPVCSATYRKWDRQRQYKARGLVPSSLFLLAIVPASVLTLIFDDELREVRVTGGTCSSLLISAIATGYFIYDCGVVLYHFKDDGAAMLLHGLLCMVTYGLATSYHVYQFYSPTFLLFELTTLFINMRWLLVELGLKESKMYLYNGLSLLLAWFVVRIVWGYSSSYVFWVDTVAGYRSGVLPAPIVLWYTIANIALNALNTVWFAKILKGAIKALTFSSPVSKED